MQKVLAYPLTVLFFVFFGLTLVIFHPIQWFCLKVFGYQAHKSSVDWLNFFLMRCTNLLGTRYRFDNPQKIGTNRPVIIAANHQSMYDIPPIIWHMRKHHPKFISKKELGKGIPSVSFNLRHGGAALIDRKNPEQALAEITRLAKYAEENKRSVAIFPEGTRSRTGAPKKFQMGGLKTLLEHMPNALVVPVTINNSWKMLRYGKFPMGIGTYMKFKVHPPIDPKEMDRETLLQQLEETVTKAIITK